MGCWEIKQTASHCSFRKRPEALTYIGQMLGRQLERVGRSEPKGTQGLQESCFLLAQAQTRPAAATSPTRAPLVLHPHPASPPPAPHWSSTRASPSHTLFLLALPLSLFPPLFPPLPFPLSPTLSFHFLTPVTPDSAVHVGTLGKGSTLPDAGAQAGSSLDLF